MATLVEKYRPRWLRQVVGQDKVVRGILAMLSRRAFDGGAFWIDGETGTGKTTIAQCIARALGVNPKPGSWDYEEIDGAGCTVETVRELTRQGRTGAGAMFKGFRVFVVNEAHNMTPKAVQAWLTLLDPLPDRWVVIFTTTDKAKDLFNSATNPFKDRTWEFRLTNQGLAETFAGLAYRIATREGLNGKPPEEYLKLVKRCHNSMRAALREIEKGAMLA